MSDNTVLKVNNLYKIFGPNPKEAYPLLNQGYSKEQVLDKTGNTVAINDANFDIHKRETFVIMGLSGSGKSTVIRCLNRLITPTSGEVLLEGENIMDMDQEKLNQLRRQKMSMVFQNFGLFPHRSIINNVAYGLEIGGMEQEERMEKAKEAIRKVGLQGYEDKKPNELSGGMQQRVGLARALANDPPVLLMDEAFSALDPLIRADMQDELLELQEQMHKTIVFITHDLDEALKLGDRIAIMKDGRVVQTGTSEDILTNPADDYVAAFVQNVDRTKIITTSTIMRKPTLARVPKDGPKYAARQMEKNGVSSIYIVDQDRRFRGLATIDDVLELQRKKEDSLESIIRTELETTTPDTSIKSLLPKALVANYPIPVLDDQQRILGIVDRASIMNELGANMTDVEGDEPETVDESLKSTYDFPSEPSKEEQSASEGATEEEDEDKKEESK